MSPRKIRRDDRTQLSISTRTRSKSMSHNANYNIDFKMNEKSMNLKKGKKRLVFVNTESERHNKSMSLDIKTIRDEDNSTSAIKQMKKLNTSLYNKGHFTPRRSTKTPKESPKNLSSPGTHSMKRLRLSKTPRKSTGTESVKSLAESEKNNISHAGTDSPVRTRHSDVDVSMSSKLSKRDTSLFPKAASERKSRTKGNASSIGTKHGIRRFSKSPKIVLRSPKSKSKSRSKKSIPKKSRSPNSKIVTVQRFSGLKEKKISPLKEEGKSAFRRKSDADARNIPHRVSSNVDVASSPKRFSYTKDIFALKEPIVVLQRLSNGLPNLSSSLSLPSLSIKANATNRRFSDGNKNISRTSFSGTTNYSRKISKSSGKERNVKRLQKSQEIAVARPSRKSVAHKTMPTDDGFDYSSRPLMSPTPGNERQRSKGTEKIGPVKVRRTWNVNIESNKDHTFDTRKEPPATVTTVTLEKEQDEETKDKDETYELLEPKTPILRKKLQEKETADKGHSDKNMTKKSFKVRFTNPSSDTDFASGFRFRTTHRGKEQIADGSSSSSVASKRNFKKDVAKSPSSLFHGIFHSGNRGGIRNVGFSTPPTSSTRLYPRSNSITSRNSSTASPFMGSAEKSGPNCSATKKVPNFAEIHKKMFAKSESLVEAKKRLMERHIALTALKDSETTKLKINPKEDAQSSNKPCNGPYNRFGFKIRKDDATNCILKKSGLHLIRNKQQQKNRALIKGVRMNRRFELQMKCRNINV